MRISGKSKRVVIGAKWGKVLLLGENKLVLLFYHILDQQGCVRAGLDEQNLARQCWIIEATLATLLIGSEGISRKVLLVSPTPSLVTREGLIAEACAVGDRLDKLAARSEYGACWLGVRVVNGNAWSLLPTDIDLYSGTSGIVLFPGYLGAVTGETRYIELARLALTSVQHQIEQQTSMSTWNQGGWYNWSVTEWIGSFR